MRVVIERRAEERAQKSKLLQEKSQYQNEALQLGMSIQYYYYYCHFYYI